MLMDLFVIISQWKQWIRTSRDEILKKVRRWWIKGRFNKIWRHVALLFLDVALLFLGRSFFNLLRLLIDYRLWELSWRQAVLNCEPNSVLTTVKHVLRMWVREGFLLLFLCLLRATFYHRKHKFYWFFSLDCKRIVCLSCDETQVNSLLMGVIRCRMSWTWDGMVDVRLSRISLLPNAEEDFQVGQDFSDTELKST